MFKKPKDVERYVTIWGWMDDIVRTTKKGKALTYWKQHSVPRDSNGKLFNICCNGKLAKLGYADITVNRYGHSEFFAEDMRHYERLYSVFARTINMK